MAVLMSEDSFELILLVIMNHLLWVNFANDSSQDVDEFGWSEAAGDAFSPELLILHRDFARHPR